MSVQILVLGPGDETMLSNVAPDVFDDDVRPDLAREFLSDPRHHLVVAREAGQVVGMATGVHYIHPDKPAELWINEVGVAPTHHRQGLGRRLLQALLAAGRAVGCRQAWVLTEPANAAAIGLYRAVGGNEGGETVMLEFDLRSD
jgi:ribosomal protein S18 acetylase RimI-like enzyme